MGNCQAIDNATLVIQNPCGRVDKLFWPVTAGEIMKTNPGHYVALLLTTTVCPTTTSTTTAKDINNTVRITRIKLLRPTDTLLLGHVYRLITAQEVMKGLWAKKYAKMKKEMAENHESTTEKAKLSLEREARRTQTEKINQGTKHERNRAKTTSAAANSAIAKARAWQPSLQSISEAAS